MKTTPETHELSKEEIEKAISYYLTRMGYAGKEHEDKMSVPSDQFLVHVCSDMTATARRIKQ